VPIFLTNGQFFGTLCGIGPKPARLNTAETVGMFKLFANLIAFHLEAQERLKLSETALLDERETAQLREQFIAVMGHDLRNPLNAVRGGADLLLLMPLDKRATSIASLIQRSAVRMAELIDNVMDFARGRLGGGLALSRVVEEGLETILEQVIAEVRAAWPGREIRSELTLNKPFACDGARVAQLLSNLLANALTHGDPVAPVWVRAHTDERNFELSVTNFGDPIPADTIEHLFQPFSRGSVEPGQQGLGLGLYIASEIARAHEGLLEVASSAEETRFTFRMPITAWQPEPARD
jgi:signal transduction histidine kinase